MVECPRCGNEAEFLAGDVFVLVWCDSCTDFIEVGDLTLHRSGCDPTQEKRVTQPVLVGRR